MQPVDPRIDPRLVPPGSRAVVVAEHQDEYENLPSIVTPMYETITRWTLTEEERAAIAAGEDIFVTIIGVPIRPFFATVGPVDWSWSK